jgi:hypothetical protein
MPKLFAASGNSLEANCLRYLLHSGYGVSRKLRRGRHAFHYPPSLEAKRSLSAFLLAKEYQVNESA